MGCAWGVHGVCMGCAWGVLGVCLGCARGVLMASQPELCSCLLSYDECDSSKVSRSGLRKLIVMPM
jgi:hypothetical protein